MTDKNIKIDSDFVEEEDVPRGHETHGELNAASFAIGNIVHVSRDRRPASQVGGPFVLWIVTSAPLMSFFPARICKRVDFPAVLNGMNF
jgi:hypothetical protein